MEKSKVENHFKHSFSSRINSVQNAECDSWREMFPILEELTGISREEGDGFNSLKWKEFFIAVEKWGYHECMRRVEMDDFKPQGVFWEASE